MQMKLSGAPMLAVLLASLSWNQAGAQAVDAGPGGLSTPAAILTEHQHLRAAVARAISDGGAVGMAARNLERTLTTHLKHEEELVLPPLGLLRTLADGEDVADSKRVLTLVQQVERELPQLMREHRAILDEAKRLKDAAAREGKREYLTLADQLWTHVVIEDQVLYPASILVARYLTLKQAAAPPAPRSPGGV